MMFRLIPALFIVCLCSQFVQAEVADVISAEIINQDGDQFTFIVTVRHQDEGWHHFADRWEILTPDREIITGRVLRHPHVDEQPFTRNLPNVILPAEIEKVIIRAHCLKDGFGGQEIFLNLPDKANDLKPR